MVRTSWKSFSNVYDLARSGTEEKPWEQQVRRYEVALLRLKQECPQVPNVIFGKMTHEEWIKLTLRHAELHLSFLADEGKTP